MARPMKAILLTVLAMCGASAIGGAQEPLRIVMPFAAGSSTDALARIVAQEIGTALNRTAIVENRTGAAGRIGVQAVKVAAPDGSTLLFTPIAPMAVYPSVYQQLPYDPGTDFEPISRIATFDFGLAVAKNIPVTNVPDLIRWLKANPASASYGSPGAGTLPHFFGVLLSREAGLDLRHVAFRGASAAVSDLAAGQIAMVLANTGELVEMHKAGLIRVLATSGSTRSPFLPDVPNFQESGYPIEGVGWLGLYAPAHTSSAVLERLNSIVVATLSKRHIHDRIVAMGFEPDGSTREAFAEARARDQAFWAPIVKSAGFVPEQ